MARTSVSTIKANYQHLTGADKKIADFILANPAPASEMTIQDLAENVKVSTATVSRFVKRIGWHSFREFSLGFGGIANQTDDFFSEIEEGDAPAVVVDKVFQGADNALDATRALLKEKDLSAAITLLTKARTLSFFGFGGSSVAALDGYHKFLRTTTHPQFHPDVDIQLMQAVKMDEQDVAILVSHSGRNHDTLMIADQLRANHVPMIAITSYPASPLAKKSTLVFQSVAEEVNYRSESMSSLIAQLTIIDSLFTLVGAQGAKTKTGEGLLQDVRHAMETSRE
nr:MurR/RpiR family transcriptional regulator [Furfurilactobacillus siliginis]